MTAGNEHPWRSSPAALGRQVRVAAAVVLATTSFGAAAGGAQAGSTRCPGNCHEPTQPTGPGLGDYSGVNTLLWPGCREDEELRQSICD